MDSRVRLAFERTFLAHERTQMAWLRTCLAFISFGFAIAKFYQYLQKTQGENAPHWGPRTVGLLMISIGLVSLVLASLQHLRALKVLRSECPGLPHSVAGVTAGVILVLGILAFFIALF